MLLPLKKIIDATLMKFIQRLLRTRNKKEQKYVPHFSYPGPLTPKWQERG
jgi:hypothetical protein